MDRRRIAQELALAARDLLAAGRISGKPVDPAALIRSQARTMRSLDQVVGGVVRIFQQAEEDLRGLERIGAGDTEAPSLMGNIVPEVFKLKSFADSLYELCRDSLKWGG